MGSKTPRILLQRRVGPVRHRPLRAARGARRSLPRGQGWSHRSEAGWWLTLTTTTISSDSHRSDTLRGLKPCSFTELLPSNMPGVPRTTWRKPGYLRGLGPLPTALGTLQPATRLGGAVAYGDVCDSSNSSIMVDVLRGDLLPTTANIELPKSQFHRTRGRLSFKDRSQKIITRLITPLGRLNGTG